MIDGMYSKLKTRFAADKPLYRRISKIAIPAFIELFLSSLFNVADVIMVGKLGTYAIAGVGICTQPFNLLISIFAAVNVGTTTLVSWGIGSGEKERANYVARQAITFNIFFGSFMAIIGFLLSGSILSFMTTDPYVHTLAISYMRIICCGLVFQSITMAISAALRGCGKTGFPLIYNLTANALNVILNYLLIFGKFGMPRMEVAGAALATAISNFVACMIALSILIFFKSAPIRISLKQNWKPDFDVIKNIFKIGFPAAGEQLVIQSGLMFFAKVVSGIGVNAYAAHQICTNINGMVFSISQAFGVATASLVGQSVGADDYSMAERITQITKNLARLITGILAIFLIVLSKNIAALYVSDKEVIDLAASVFYFIGLIHFFQSIQMSTSGALRASGDTMYPLYASIFGIWIFRVGAGFLLVNILHLGLWGAWLSFFLDQLTRTTTVWLRFKSGKWKLIKAKKKLK